MSNEFDDRHHHRGHHKRGHRGRGGPFGGRRPLRFLARRLNLSEEQFRKVAAIMNDLRNARQQAALDNRRAMVTYAEAFDAETFTPEATAAAGTQRVTSAEAMHAAMTTALQQLHEVLAPEQRADLALLLREAPPWLL